MGGHIRFYVLIVEQPVPICIVQQSKSKLDTKRALPTCVPQEILNDF